MKIQRWTSCNKTKASVSSYKWKKIVTNNGVIIMSKVINLFDYKKKVRENQAYHFTKEERMDATEHLIYDDDTYLEDFMIDNTDDLKEM
ncbi:hypothetical protein CBC_A1673 [Clostridium botulinum C str. Eklund]|uniref:hypothetical protein n=1 Tax=Clostridium botulinum TaxID=1491 RepID=UPI000166413B|nr:hypothetical protein [Clostridium botulinum]EDS77056.1 hypothetical protein CBC_A1673 [Clostridium botulinum C str. Eklund]QPW61988.1 hypothetical protein IG390_14125 [Clostridium botulinum]